MEKDKLEPKLRFPGFTEPWEHRKLGDEAHIIMGQSPDGSTYSKEPSDYILIQGNADLINGWVVPRTWTTQITKLAEPGDLIMSVRAPAGEMGKTLYKAVIGRGVAAIKGNEFLYQLLTKMNVEGYWKRLAAGSTFESLNSKDINNSRIAVPPETEQEQIGRLFSTIDKTIALHQRKEEELQKLKKGLLQKMFPKDGESVPEVRFPNFTNTWEHRKLGDEAHIIMGQSPDGSTYSKEPSDYILIQGNADLINGWVVPRTWTTQITKLAEPGDLIMSVRAPAGEMGKTLYKAVIGRGVAAIKGNEFLYQLLTKMNVEGYWKRLAAGSTFESLNSKDINNSRIAVPPETEQEQIGRLFSTIDKTIALHHRKTEELKKLKKALLQQMFV